MIPLDLNEVYHTDSLFTKFLTSTLRNVLVAVSYPPLGRYF